jgi:hypothetical protein
MANNGRRIPLTTIGRTIDLSYRTNLAIFLVSLVALIAGLVVTVMIQGEALGSAVLTSLAWAGGVFLSWALARELDPDRWYSAFFAAAGGFFAASMFAPPGLLTLFWFLIALRFINRSTGLAPGWIDVIGYCGIALWLGYSVHWTIPLLAVTAFLAIEIKQFSPPVPFLLTIGLPVASLALGHVQRWQIAQLGFEASALQIGIVVAIALATVPVIHSYRVVRSVADRTDKPLEPRRVQWALAWAVGASIALTYVASVSIAALAPSWAALAGAFAGWLFEAVFKRTPSAQSQPTHQN